MATRSGPPGASDYLLLSPPPGASSGAVTTPTTSCPWASDGRAVPDYHGAAMSRPAPVALAYTVILTSVEVE